MSISFSDKIVNICAPSTIKDSAVITWWHFKQSDYMVESNEIVEIEEGEIVHIVYPPSKGMILQVLAAQGSEVKANQIIATFQVMGFKSQLVATLKNFINRK
jgi:multidrug efflux pump subunit AcrA (membrane-fusion protein)